MADLTPGQGANFKITESTLFFCTVNNTVTINHTYCTSSALLLWPIQIWPLDHVELNRSLSLAHEGNGYDYDDFLSFFFTSGEQDD